MIRMSWLKMASVGIIAMASVANVARANAVFGDFETPAVDGFGTAGGDASFNGEAPTYTQSTIGVTLGSNSLAAIAFSAGASEAMASGNLWTQAGVGPSVLEQATQLSYDETFLSASLFVNGTETNSPSFAQTNVLIYSIFGTGGSLGTSTVNVHGQETVAQGGATDILTPTSGTGTTTVGGTSRGTWSGVDGTHHMTWNLGGFTATDPTDGVTKTFGALFAAHPDVAWNVLIQLPEQTGDNTPDGAPGDAGRPTFYFDAMTLVTPTPEPASLGGLALLSLLGLRRRK